MSRPLLILAVLAGCAQPGPPVEEGDASEIYRRLTLENLPKCVAEFWGAREARGPVEEAIATYANALAELTRAARQSRSEWKYETPPSLVTETPHASVAVNGSRLLVARARLRLLDGHLSEAVNSLLVSVKLGGDFLQDRPIIPLLTGMIAVGLTDDVFRAAWGDLSRDPRELRRIEDAFGALVARYPSWRRVMENQRALLDATVGVIRERGIGQVMAELERSMGSPVQDHRKESLLMNALLRAEPEVTDATIFRRLDVLWRPILADADEMRLGVPQRFNPDAHKQAMKEKVGDKETVLDIVARMSPDERGELAADLIFALGAPAVVKARLTFTNLRLLAENLRDACRLEQARLRSGRYPDRLDRGFDPYDGQTLKYRRIATPDGEGFVLTAAGPKSDWEERVRVLVQDCRFDGPAFEQKSQEYAESMMYTFWFWQPVR